MFCMLEGFRICSSKKRILQTGKTTQAVRSGVETALVSKGKGIEAFMAVEGVCVLGSLEPVDDEVGDGRGDDLVADLEGVAGSDDVDEGMNGVDSAEG